MPFMIFTSQKHKKLSDKDLIVSFRQHGDTAMIDELFNRYGHHVLSICYHYLKSADESKDAVIEIFQKLLKTLEKEEIKQINRWLSIVTRNHCISKLRKVSRKKIVYLESNDLDKMYVENFDLERHIIERDERNRLNQVKIAFKKLNIWQRKCLLLFYDYEKSYREIAETLGITLGQVKSHIQNGKRNLRIILNHSEGEI